MANYRYTKAIAGSCAIGIGLGVVRFDFAVVGRLMIESGLFSASSIGELSSLNLAGYILGCLHHSQLRILRDRRVTLWIALLTIPISLFAEGLSSALAMHAFWRILAGWASGHLMSGIPHLATLGCADRQRRRASALVMAGAGIGALIGALSVGSLPKETVELGWMVLGTVAAVLAIPVGWLLLVGFRDEARHDPEAPLARGEAPKIPASSLLPLAALTLGYLLLGAGQTPVALYEPLLVSERLGASPMLSSTSLAVFGAGCTTGSLLASTFPRRWPTVVLLPIVACLGLLGNILFLTGSSATILGAATFCVGAWIWLTASLTFDRLSQLVDPSELRPTWSLITMILGIGFALFAFATSPLVSQHIDGLILIGVVVVVLQVIAELIQWLGDRRHRHPDEANSLRFPGGSEI